MHGLAQIICKWHRMGSDLSHLALDLLCVHAQARRYVWEQETRADAVDDTVL